MSRLSLDVIAWDIQACVSPDRRSLTAGGPGTLRTCCVFRNGFGGCLRRRSFHTGNCGI